MPPGRIGQNRAVDTIERITDRQLEVACLIAEGRSNPEIAEALHVSLAGAKYHVSELLGRLGVSSRDEIAEWYRQREGIPTRRGWRDYARMLVPAGAILGAVAGAAIVSVALSGGRADSNMPVSATTETPAAFPTESFGATPVAPNAEKIPLFWEYTIQLEDSVASIAQRFGISQETLIWNNVDLDVLLAQGSPNSFVQILPPGSRVRIPTIDGILHVAQPGETVAGIAERYDAEEQDILDLAANGLGGDPNNLEAGTLILVPGGTRAVAPLPGNGDAWAWPVQGEVTTGFSPDHPEGIDVLAPLDAEVRAARAGQVAFVGGDPCCDDGYHVIIEHDDGYTSLYAHLGGFRVEDGQSVEAGEVIGTVGTSGSTDEPHLHFEIRRGDVYQDPLSFLP